MQTECGGHIFALKHSPPWKVLIVKIVYLLYSVYHDNEFDFDLWFQWTELWRCTLLLVFVVVGLFFFWGGVVCLFFKLLFILRTWCCAFWDCEPNYYLKPFFFFYLVLRPGITGIDDWLLNTPQLVSVLSPSPIHPPWTPQWGSADAEIKDPSVESPELKSALFKAWSRSVYGWPPTARDFFLATFYPPGPFTCIVSKTFPECFPVLAVATTVSSVGLQNKIEFSTYGSLISTSTVPQCGDVERKKKESSLIRGSNHRVFIVS